MQMLKAGDIVECRRINRSVKGNVTGKVSRVSEATFSVLWDMGGESTYPWSEWKFGIRTKEQFEDAYEGEYTDLSAEYSTAIEKLKTKLQN